MGQYVGQLTMEPSKIGRRQSEIIKFKKKRCVQNLIGNVVKIEINGIKQTLGMKKGSNEVKISKNIIRLVLVDTHVDGI
jgi:hypothetical protein